MNRTGRPSTPPPINDERTPVTGPVRAQHDTKPEKVAARPEHLLGSDLYANLAPGAADAERRAAAVRDWRENPPAITVPPPAEAARTEPDLATPARDRGAWLGLVAIFLLATLIGLGIVTSFVADHDKRLDELERVLGRTR